MFSLASTDYTNLFKLYYEWNNRTFSIHTGVCFPRDQPVLSKEDKVSRSDQQQDLVVVAESELLPNQQILGSQA